MRILAVLAIAAFLACQIMPVLADDGSSTGGKTACKEPSIFQKVADSCHKPSRVLDAPKNKLKQLEPVKKIAPFQDSYDDVKNMDKKK